MKDGDKLAWSSSGPAPADAKKSISGPPASGNAAAGTVRVRIERSGRGGKVVSVVENLPGHPERIQEIAKALKARCGAGGTVKGRVIEVQGDHRERIVAALVSLGLSARSS